MELMYNYSVSGIDFSLPANGGRDCLEFISGSRRFFEDVLGVSLGVLLVYLGLKWHKRPEKRSSANPYEYPPARMALLVLMTLAFAMEATYKLSTRQFIYMLQPCHVLCLVHIFLLAWPQNHPFVTYLFRIHLSFMHGPLFAMLFPFTWHLTMPGEVFTYWFEHVMLLSIPLYLLRQGGDLFTVEPLTDVLGWPLLCYGIWMLYHWAVLELTAVTTLGNMNMMLCPVSSDPFYGPNWRLCALLHQFFLTFVTGKLYALIGRKEKTAND